MVYRYLFPARGGGWARRYWQYRQQLASSEWYTSDGIPMPPVTLFDFTREIDRADASAISGKDSDGWRISDDQVIGGFSTSNAALIRTTNCWRRHIDEGITDSKEQLSNEELNSTMTPYLRWYGNLDTTLGLESKAQRSGFCALRSPEFPFEGANLQGLFECLEIQCRESTPICKLNKGEEVQERMYTVNVKVSSSVIDDIYQGHLALETGHGHEDDPQPLLTFLLPFRNLQLTAGGRDREYSRRLDDSVKIESIGFVLMDGIDGNFSFDFARARAVNRSEDGSVYEGPTEDATATAISERN